MPKLAVTGRSGQGWPAIAQTHALRDGGRVGGVGRGEENAELLPAITGCDVVLAEAGPDRLGHGPEGLVALRVAVGVVVGLELIDVQEDESEREMGAGRELDVPLTSSSSKRRRLLRPVNESVMASAASLTFLAFKLRMNGENAAGDLQASGELLGVGWLGEEIVGPGTKPLNAIAPGSPGGQEDEVNIAAKVGLSDPSAERRAVEPRHHPVRDDDRRVAFGDGPPCGLAVGRDLDLVAHPFERTADDHRHHELVFGDEDLHGIASPIIAQMSSVRSRSQTTSASRAADLAAIRSPREAASSASRHAPASSSAPTVRPLPLRPWASAAIRRTSPSRAALATRLQVPWCRFEEGRDQLAGECLVVAERAYQAPQERPALATILGGDGWYRVEGMGEFVLPDGLGDIAVDAGSQASLAVALHGVGRHGDRADVPAGLASCARMAAVASRPSISGICTSISTTSNAPDVERLQGLPAVVRPRRPGAPASPACARPPSG